MTVSGAYGRDYTSLAKAQADWDAGKDFIIRDLFSGEGRYVNKEDTALMTTVMVRYSKDRKVGRLK